MKTLSNIFLLTLFLVNISASSQELFPNTEPASTVPKGVLGVRIFEQTYPEYGLYRNLTVLRLMYGVLPKLTVMANVNASDHHDINFPANLVSHTHNGNQSTFSTGNFQRGIQYPTIFNGVYLYAKYRFLTLDKDDQHLRISAYADWSNINVAHDETEPTLLDDTKGYGGGLIITSLKKRFAVSLTTGIIVPGKYDGFSPDLQGGPLVPTQIKYGQAFKYDLSIGYLLYPFQYKNYDQPNINIYVEFIGKSYKEATVFQYGVKPVPIQTPLLEAGNYVDATPGIQLILRSNLRLDFSVELPFINKSYAHFYPMYMLGIQRYFFLKKK